MFLYAFEFVMTRSYGRYLPSSAIIPYCDLFNHSSRGYQRYVVHKKYELEQGLKPQNYKLKSKHFRLDILDNPKLKFDEKY
jgi:hypothetical protein